MAKKKLPILTNSRRSTFQACARKHHYNYQLRKSPIHDDREILNFGNLFHAGAEAWLLAPSKNRLEAAIEAVRGYYNKNFDEKDRSPFELAKAEVVMIGYDIRWGDDPFECVGAEVEFTLPLLHPTKGTSSRLFMVGGKLDGVVDMTFEETHGRWVMEHKTTKPENLDRGTVYWRRLRGDGQVSMYWDAAERNGWELEGVIYDVVGRPDQRPFAATPEETKRWTKGKKCKVCTAAGLSPIVDERGKPTGEINCDTKEFKLRPDCPVCKGTCYEVEPWLDKRQRAEDETVEEYRERISGLITKEPWHYYQRGIVTRRDLEIEEARWDLWLTAKQIREIEKVGRYPRNPNSCTMYSRTCAYFDVCWSGGDINDPHLFETRSVAHPELSEEIQEVFPVQSKEETNDHGEHEEEDDYEELPF